MLEEGGNSDALAKLTKQLKGLLNRWVTFWLFEPGDQCYLRMSEQNLSVILNSVEDLYRDNRRNGIIPPSFTSHGFQFRN